VIDPGHSPAIRGIDPVTDLNVSGYENEPEMRDVFAVAELVKAQLQAAGYRVIMTKATVDTPVLLNQIAATANNAHAALALSIHDQAGNNGGIGFNQGNNIVYDQSVGDYRVAGMARRPSSPTERLPRSARSTARSFVPSERRLNLTRSRCRATWATTWVRVAWTRATSGWSSCSHGCHGSTTRPAEIVPAWPA
jgi:N-acetylmuramoyl-L-alanine amidase